MYLIRESLLIDFYRIMKEPVKVNFINLVVKYLLNQNN